MFCPRCGFNNVDTANYCGGCALVLTAPRPQAGPSSAAAPSSAGAPSATPPPPAAGPPRPVPFGAPQGGWGQASPQALSPGPAVVAPHWSGMAIAGFVISFFCGVLGLVFSILGYRECREGEGRVQGAGLAIAGMVISVLMLLYYVGVAFR